MPDTKDPKHDTNDAPSPHRGLDGVGDELLETAREISAPEIEAVIQGEAKVRAERFERAELERQQAWRNFYRHVGVFAVANALAFVLDSWLTGGVWFYWMLLGWGAGLVLHLVGTIRATGRSQEPPRPDSR